LEERVKKFSVILLGGVILLSPAIVPAQSASLEICNNGRYEIDVAIAARVQYVITGYRWKNSGWYVVPAHGCAIVYSEDYDAAGPFTPQSEALVAYTLINPDGIWGAYKSQLKGGGGWIRHGSGEICVKQGEVFESTRPAGDPAANCDGRTIPVADEFLPDGPGKFTLTMDWEGDTFFVPLGKAVASSNTPAKPPEDSIGMQFLKALAKEAAEEGRKQEQAKADAAAAERQRQEAAAEAQRQADLAASTPPPSAPPTPAPASPSDDDPIGAGGFITPPDQRDVVLCVQAGLIQLDHDSWNMPVIGGKMVTFQNFVGPYILSVAQPGWQYGIGDQAYARFNPAATADPASFVFAIPPGQQATPGSCPEGYSIFWLQKTGQIKCRGCE
jgi:hypothetical protein